MVAGRSSRDSTILSTRHPNIDIRAFYTQLPPVARQHQLAVVSHHRFCVCAYNQFRLVCQASWLARVFTKAWEFGTDKYTLESVFPTGKRSTTGAKTRLQIRSVLVARGEWFPLQKQRGGRLLVLGL